MNNRLHRRRLFAERRFRAYGVSALVCAVVILAVVIGVLLVRGMPGFFQTQIRVSVTDDAARAAAVASAPASSFNRFAQAALSEALPDAPASRELFSLLTSFSGAEVKEALRRGETDMWIPADSRVDGYIKNPAAPSRLSDRQRAWLDRLKADGRLRTAFNPEFFTRGDSRSPEQAGFGGAIAGSLLTLLACFLIAFPIGVATAVYLQEFARPGRFVDMVEVNINNLAAVPSIVFGLLGLAVYINVMELPRSAPLVGGMTLALMILPVIIISTRTALAAVPPAIRDAARALGATPVQVIWHHTLPLAMPGIMTGAILGMARAIGETAPLLMIGMVAFVADVPAGLTDPATAMPVQIYLWAGSPEAGFAEKTAAGILTLLVLLIALNMLAIYLRKKFEVRW